MSFNHSAVNSDSQQYINSQFSTPAIWINGDAAIHALTTLSCIADIRLYNQQELSTGRNYFIYDCNTQEWQIKALAYQNPENCYIYRIQLNQAIENFIGEAVTAKEFWIQCLDYSLTFADWCAIQDQQKISIKEAIILAKIAYERLSGLDLETELDTLRVRCGQPSFDWNKRMSSLAAEFRQELENRGLTVDPVNGDLDQKLKLDLLALSQESDPIKKLRKRSEICSYFRLSKSEVEELLKHINRSTNQSELKSYTLDDLFDLESEGLSWVIPEMLPRGETIILAGSPKAGKSLLAVDAAFAIATGESRFLGENVVAGKVLLVSCDESLNSTKSKLIKRGFRRGDSIEILPQWTIDRLHDLEQKIEDCRPDVVIIDSLKRITHGSQISENSAEFADNIYTLKELFAKYSCSGILIHHSNKNNEATGVHKLRGSSAIAGAVWGTWQIDHILRPDPDNKKKMIIDPKDPVRVLSIFARDAEGQSLKIEFNPEDNSWERLGIEDDAAELSYRERILNVLEKNSHCDGLSGKEIMNLLGEDGNKSIYSELNRMVNKRLISCKPANNDKRINLYSLPVSQQPQNTGGDSPSPIPIVQSANYYPQTLTTYSFDNSQQNSQQIVSNGQQLPEKINLSTNGNPYPTAVTVDSQQLSEIGGGEGVLPDCTEVVNIADNVLSAEIQEPIKVGDKVLVPHPQANDQGDTVREVGGGWLMVDWIPVKFPLAAVIRL
ncbi:AAA family ATPase [Dolichospermum sp. UHCC 0259]|uniref:AAA family ATPase n=1 Tax=Dolichospermum sp. UHCC 0259 TaxID=2590010 RepID=UPI001445019D|nr:AAA family ATPase [Dolichospermum sp. UHCC 0259]MTJ50671.1 AAA family ATPase [Dolichospermum sp. UHCC 0259]